MFWNTDMTVFEADPTYAIMPSRRMGPADLDAEELARAHGALAYLKAKIGNDRMRELLADDLATMTERTGRWSKESKGWKSANFKLIVPGPGATAFHSWFLQMMKEDRQLELRAAHPDHFMNIPLGGTAKVIENVGEDNLPWYIELEFTSDEERFPVTWDPSYQERLGAVIFNADRVQIGSAMHEMRDTSEGTEISLTIILPDAAPDSLLEGHLRHFAVEFRNWTRMAREQMNG
jgi:hypothetical protein